MENLEAARAAAAGGSDRIELCADLSAGGITPAIDLLTSTIEALSIPVFVMIRSRGGDFTGSSREIDQMRRHIEAAKRAGAAGVVLGVLDSDRRVDVDRSRSLVDLARPMKVTFHRAFDATPDLGEALEAVIETGADCVLTSGGKPDVLTGADAIAQLRKQAARRIDVMAGGGLTLDNLEEVVRRTDVSHLHGSLSGKRVNGDRKKKCAASDFAALEVNVREAVRLFRKELAMRGRSFESSAGSEEARLEWMG